MILYLLAPLLVVGVESQTANVTEDDLRRTFNVSAGYNGTMNRKPGNVSSHEDEMSRVEEALHGNHTSPFVAEDDEDFQDQEREFPNRSCYRDDLVKFSHDYCGLAFHEEMARIGPERWCQLERIARPYSDVTSCLEELSQFFNCYFPNPEIQDFFVGVHSYYFQNCTSEDGRLEDAPHWLVMVLTLVPVSLIPVLVYLVVWKSNVQE